MKTFTASAIIHYHDNLGRCGKHLGTITLTDGKSLKVWLDDTLGDELHRQCRQLAAFPSHEVRYQFRHSDKWGDSLTMIESTKTDYELRDMAREIDEQRGRLKPNSYLGSRLKKDVQTQVDDEQRQIPEHKALMERG